MLLEKDVPNPKIKIIDFGLAQKLEDGTTFKSLCGTPQYIGEGLGWVPELSTPALLFGADLCHGPSCRAAVTSGFWHQWVDRGIAACYGNAATSGVEPGGGRRGMEGLLGRGGL